MCRNCERNICKELPRLGVRLDFLERFIKENNIPSDWTTERVVQEIVKVQTQPHQRYTDVIEAKYPEEGYVGPEPSVFISHAWNRPFVELVTTLSRGRIFGRSNRKKYVWLDIFTVHQHDGKYKQMDLGTITECIRTIGYTVVILDNGISPEKFALIEKVSKPVALTRIWCLYEIWNTIRYGGDVRLISSSILFGGNGRCGWFVKRRPFEVSCLDAQATKAEDLSRNLAEMEHAEGLCPDRACAGNPLVALPYANVLKILADEGHEQKQAFCIKKCNRSRPEDFKYYVLFCKCCNKTLVCRDCLVSNTTMISLVDKTINDGILTLWAQQRFYLIYVVVAISCLILGVSYGIKRIIIDGDRDAASVHESMLLGVLLFFVMTMFLIFFSCICKMARMAKFYRCQLSEFWVLGLYVTASVFAVLVYYVGYVKDEENSFMSYSILSFCLCFFFVLDMILYLYRTRSLSRSCRINLIPGTWTWFFLFCWCYYPNCLSWLLCDCIWIKGHRHKAPRKCFKNMEAFCNKLLKPCSMCFTCGRPRGVSYVNNERKERRDVGVVNRGTSIL